MEAEGQHQMRLSQEEKWQAQHPETAPETWHKTTIVISDPSNPWPASKPGDRDALFRPDNREALLRAARYRIRRLTVGALEVGKQRAGKTPDTQPARALSRAKTTPLRLKDEADTPASAEEPHAEVRARIQAAALHQFDQSGIGQTLSDNDNHHEKKVLGAKVKELIKQNQGNPNPEQRCLVVTERIRVMIPSENMCIVLDRTHGGYFTAHAKTISGKAPPYKGQGKTPAERQPRRFWHSSEPPKYRAGKLMSKGGFFAASSPSPSSLRHTQGMTLLEAAHANNLYLVESLIDFEPEETDKQERNLLHYAVMHENEEMVRFLCSSRHLGEWLDKPDVNKNTPLHYAYSRGNQAIIEILQDHGANQHTPNDEGKRPEDIHRDEISSLIEGISKLDISSPGK